MIQVYLSALNNFIPVRNPELCKAIDSFTNSEYFRLTAIDPTGRKFYIDFSPSLWNNDNFIDIDGKKFRYCEIEKNPDYVIALVEQEANRCAIEDLSG
jgi:hypothetical protein